MRRALKTTLLTALPLMLGMTANAVSQLINRIYLGRFSETALAACLPGGMLAVFFSGFMICMIGYTSTFIAQFHGARKQANAHSAFIQGLYLAAFAIPIFLLTIPVGDLLIGLAGHTSELKRQECIAFHYAVYSGIATLVTTILSGYFTGQGKTRLVGLATAAGCLVNISIAPLFIFQFGMGVAGAGLASVIGNAVPCLAIAVAIANDTPFKTQMKARNYVFRPVLARRILKFGTPFGLSALVGSGTFTVFVMALGHLSSSALAVGNACFAINNIFYIMLCAIESAIAILVGRAVGNNNDSDARKFVTAGHILTSIALLLCYIPILGNTTFALRLFSGGEQSTTPDFLHYGHIFLTILLIREIFEWLQHIYTGALRGAGDTCAIFKAHLVASVFVQLPFIAFVVTKSLSPVWLWGTMVPPMFIHAVLLARHWLGGTWRNISLGVNVPETCI